MDNLINQCHNIAKEKGFWKKQREIGTLLMLIVSELSEALEADRKNKFFNEKIGVVNGWVSDDDFFKHFKKSVKDTFQDEIADTFIRLFDLCGSMEIEIESHIKAKMRYNSLREKMHGKKY